MLDSAFDTVLLDDLEPSLPQEGRHIVASYDRESIVVYQAYCRSIAESALERGGFGGGGWRAERMSWVKPSFLWMMHRSGWTEKNDQERVLAVRVRRSFFDRLLGQAVSSAFEPPFEDRESWREAVRGAEVRHQWDPDRTPSGAPLKRRALQLGLRGRVLREYAEDVILSVIDVTAFAKAQHLAYRTYGASAVSVPFAQVYPVTASTIRSRLGMG